ncbi:ParA family protein [Marinigracilibium pacificum]|uniref:ParA family protein n=1 Tax=Marinigracilibium pacificum TaxID=2729599 RepID=A0A848IXM9_9BACT|nr:ParA family protein [Marinigracilibium pacificum]NMM47030.1 ParA family protein [Marinigracilibium pacificum]
MAKIISFISRKGGTGKTTNAINLATMLNSLGYKIALIETDNNYTLNTLRKMELYKTGANENNLFPIIPSLDEDCIDEIEKLKAEGSYNYVIVDSAGKTTDKNIKKLCIASDIVIVPTSLSPNDLLVTYQTVRDLEPAKEFNAKLKIVILPNRIHSQTRKETIAQATEELDTIVIGNKVPMKNLFVNFSTILSEKEYLPVAKEILEHV